MWKKTIQDSRNILKSVILTIKPSKSNSNFMHFLKIRNASRFYFYLLINRDGGRSENMEGQVLRGHNLSPHGGYRFNWSTKMCVPCTPLSPTVPPSLPNIHHNVICSDDCPAFFSFNLKVIGFVMTYSHITKKLFSLKTFVL